MQKTKYNGITTAQSWRKKHVNGDSKNNEKYSVNLFNLNEMHSPHFMEIFWLFSERSEVVDYLSHVSEIKN